MGKATSRFFITTIQDGQSVSAELISTIKLAQNVSSGGACSPNWNQGETGAVNPIIYVYSRLNGVVKKPTAGSDKWYWNGIEITWDGNNKSSNVKDAANNPVFEKTTYGSSSLNAIKIIRNLGSATNNVDNDVISFKGSIEISGVPQDFGVDTVVRISNIAGSGYNAICGGDTDVTSNDSTQPDYTATVYGQLYSGTDLVTDLSAVKAYREGIDTDESGGGWPKTCSYVVADETTARGTLIPGGSYKVVINASEITDRCVLRFDFYKSGTKVASSWTDVDDRTDSEELYVVNSVASTVGQNDVQMRSGQTCNIKCWMGYSTNMYKRHVNPEYNSFKCMLTNAQGQVIRSGGPIPSTSGAVDAQGFFDITKNNVKVLDQSGNVLLAEGKGGELSITADFVNTSGGGIGGTILAENIVES